MNYVLMSFYVERTYMESSMRMDIKAFNSHYLIEVSLLGSFLIKGLTKNFCSAAGTDVFALLPLLSWGPFESCADDICCDWVWDCIPNSDVLIDFNSRPFSGSLWFLEENLFLMDVHNVYPRDPKHVRCEGHSDSNQYSTHQNQFQTYYIYKCIC